MKNKAVIIIIIIAIIVSVLAVLQYTNKNKFNLMGKWEYESLNKFRPVQIKDEEIEVEFFEKYYLFNKERINIKSISINEEEKTVELITEKNTVQIKIIDNNKIRFKQPDNKIGTKSYIRKE